MKIPDKISSPPTTFLKIKMWNIRSINCGISEKQIRIYIYPPFLPTRIETRNYFHYLLRQAKVKANPQLIDIWN